MRNIGHKGQGPGEYRDIGALRTFRDGRIVVWDNSIQRLSTFTATGEYAANTRVPSGLHASDIMHVDNTGRVFVKTVTSIDRATSKFDFAWIRISPQLKVLDTIAVPKNPFPKAFSLATPSGFDQPFTHELISTVTAAGALLSGDNAQYAFELKQPGGSVLRVERQFVPVPVTSNERDQWNAFTENFLRERLTYSAADRARPAPTVVIPSTKPAFHELISDSEGRVWVRRYVAAVTRPAPMRAPNDKRPAITLREQPTYDVFEPTGRFLGSVILPWNSSFQDAIGMQLWLTVTGTEGDESVVRYRMEKSR